MRLKIIALLAVIVGGAAEAQMYTNTVLPRIIDYSATTQYDRYERVAENILVTNDTFSSWYETIGSNTVEHRTNVWVVGWRTAEITLPAAVIHRLTYGFGTSEVFSICTLQTVDSGATGNWRNVEHRIWNARAVWSEFPTNDAGVEVEK